MWNPWWMEAARLEALLTKLRHNWMHRSGVKSPLHPGGINFIHTVLLGLLDNPSTSMNV